MNRHVLIAVIAIGCGSKSESSTGAGSGSAAAAARPTVTDPIGFCARARMVMVGRRKCFPEDTSIKMGLESIAELEGSAPAEPAPRRRVAADCAVMLDGMMRAEQPKNCPLDVTDDERAELSAFLAAWYGERTAPPATGDAALDAALGKLAALRDAACGCKDLACVRQAATDLATQLAALPADVPGPVRDAGAHMTDEVGRCKQRLTYGPPG